MIGFALDGSDLEVFATPAELREMADKLEAAMAEAGGMAQWGSEAVNVYSDTWATVTFKPPLEEAPAAG